MHCTSDRHTRMCIRLYLARFIERTFKQKGHSKISDVKVFENRNIAHSEVRWRRHSCLRPAAVPTRLKSWKALRTACGMAYRRRSTRPAPTAAAAAAAPQTWCRPPRAHYAPAPTLSHTIGFLEVTSRPLIVLGSRVGAVRRQLIRGVAPVPAE
ncbi:hypothetical protein RR48_06497 [Papilio machaon]|uniref:Uncharacterized protein n=1 Tax=Papilio machaon TaxID=76193 RepID=A0A194RQ71_PAPMA|nr:hypothetical protein RR48_06497 [Papilio machaon]